MIKTKSNLLYLYICVILFWGVFGSYAVMGQELSDGESGEVVETEFVEYDHYTGDRPQTYASSLADKINNIVVFIRFSDSMEYATNTSVSYAEKTYNSNENSLKKYLERISYGQIDIHTYFYPKAADGSYYSVQVTQNADYYKRQYRKDNGELTNGYVTEAERMTRENELITEAVSAVRTQLEASGLDLDLNHDGYVDGISFVAPVYGGGIDQIYHGDLLWPHKIDAFINIPINGKYVYTYDLVNRGSTNYGIMGQYGQLSGTVIHEFLHTLSLPDLYRYNDSSAHPLGNWDIMDSGSTANITAWYQREYLEFGAKLPVYSLSTNGITLQTAKYTQPDETYAVILKSSRNSDEYFVIEHRQIEPGDESGQLNGGLLVYRIIDNAAGPYSTDGNASGPPDFIFAFRPNETGSNVADGDIGYATLSPENPRGFTSLGKALGAESTGYDNQTIYYSDGSNSGIIIDNLKKNSDGSMTFDVTFPDEVRGNGTKEHPFEIRTVQDLRMLSSAKSNTYFQLMNDIDMDGKDFTMISTFRGILDGNNKAIRALKVTDTDSAAFIDYLDFGAVMKNLRFIEPVITSDRGYAAIIATVEGSMENIVVDGGRIQSGERAGGLAGVLNSDGNINNCYTSAAVLANQSGGLLSYMCGGRMTNSYACGNVSGSGSNPVTGAVVAFWQRELNGITENIYWDIEKTGQEENGLVFEDNTPLRLTGANGIKLRCPESVNTGDNAKAVLVVINNMDTLNGTWKSSDPAILAIDTDGNITGVTGGNVKIYYSFIIGGHEVYLEKSVTCIASEPPTTEPATEPPTTEPATEPPTTEPATEPPTTEPPTEPPTTEPATEPPTTEPATEPPTTEPATEPPTTAPAPTEPPTTAPTEPPTTEPASTEQPTTEPPATNPPPTEPPVTNPPSTEPPTTNPPDTKPPISETESRPQYTDEVEAFVARFYTNILNRQPDPGGLRAWTQNLKSGREQGAKVGYGFINSEEFKKRHLSDREYIKVLYRTFFDREADASGLEAWQRVLDSGLSRLHVYRGFAESDEFSKLCNKFGIQRGFTDLTAPMDQNEYITKFIVRCYRLCLDRNADESGLNGWCSQLLNGNNTAKEVAHGFIFSREFINKDLSDTEYVQILYRVFMDREADTYGLNAWVNVLHSGKDREHVFNGFADSVEFRKLCDSYGIR